MNDFIDIKVLIQPTPNPNAYKFIVNREVKANGNVTYNTPEECGDNFLAKTLFSVEGIQQLYFFENIITATFGDGIDLMAAEQEGIDIIKNNILDHDPNFKVAGAEPKRRDNLSPDVKQIEEILDRTIRPGLQGDGGDLEIVSFIDNELAIRYQGACGTCPSSTMGTLMAIQGILKDEFDPDIEVIPV
jgi:NFU1 iron-sulfur cluster scaffold homolog, mitochondrial